jgi:predicted transcriptional regulator
MGRKRFKDQILRQILEACAGGGANKTQIVYSCNLNFRSVVPYLDLLISNGLMVRVEGSIARYKTTGEAALGHMRELEKMMPEGEMA